MSAPPQMTAEQRERAARNREAAMKLRQEANRRQPVVMPPVPPARPVPPALRPTVTFRPPQASSGFRNPVPSTSASTRPRFPAPAPSRHPQQATNTASSSRQPAPAFAPQTHRPDGPFDSWSPKQEVTLEVVDHTRFKLVTRFNIDAVQEFCRSWPRRTFDSKLRAWTFEWSEYHGILAGLRNIRTANLHVKDILRSVVDYFQKPNRKSQIDPELMATLKISLWSELYEYQKNGVLHGIENGGRILIADEMGLGKSVQALSLAHYYQREWPLLIVCPSSVKGSWQAQFEKFLPGVVDITIIDKAGDIIPNHRSTNSVIILSYDMMSNKAAKLIDMRFYVIIFDESHMLKDSKAKRTKAAISLSRAANRVILLSGTPALSRPSELFTQIQMITPKLFPNFMDYALTYCDGRQMNHGFVAKGATRTEELKAIMQSTVMIRRTKDSIDLPPKNREFVYLNERNVDFQMAGLCEAKNKLENLKNPKGLEAHDSLMAYYRATALVKSSAVTAYLEKEYVDPGIDRKMLVFAHHQVVLNAICAMLNSKGVRYVRIDGSTNDRTALVDEFQTSENCRVAVLSVTAAGVGITLTAANLVIFAELHWNPATLMQAEDRAHRVGQLKTVDVIYLVAKKTADDNMILLLKKKMSILNSVALNTGSFDNTAKSNEDTTGSSKITTYFEKLKVDAAAKAAGAKDDDFDNDILIIEDDDDDWPIEIQIDDDDTDTANAGLKRPSNNAQGGPAKKAR
uniref:SWI/SNF-related matrix-associated actin-dependent regulator of chromatin subfamily A-like protein 1 n=1 Tax=Panagrellus redivivus TaxID=6233 RepID=A0A7E4VTG0_PANRE